MKAKKSAKVLVLKRTTVAHLGEGEMGEAVGGFTACCNSVVSCDSAFCTATFDDYTCRCGSDPVTSWDCMTMFNENTCICIEHRTDCTYCDC
jgi:hypothetical protein